MSRSLWNSKLGFILASAGSAVGLGAIWKFPYVTATHGGGAFLLIFLAITFTMGFALLLAEFAIGRAASTGAVGAFRQLGGRRWSLIGYCGVACCFLILSFYSVVGGWTLGYLVRAVDGRVMTRDSQALGSLFQQYVGSPLEPVITHGVFALLILLVVMAGVQKGIERAGKILMPGLFLLMLGLIIRSLTLPNALQGVLLFLAPDFSKVDSGMLVDALGLAFFHLSVGAGCMLAYGSYLDRNTSLVSVGAWVTALSTLTAVLAGLMIFPAMAAFGLDPASGPGLSYMTMPVVFTYLPMGQMFAVAFFALLLLAALMSAVSLLEQLVVLPIDEWKVSRRVATVVVTVLIFLAGIPASLSFGPWSHLTAQGRTIFQWMDYASSNVLLPLGGIGTAVFAGWKIWPLIERELGLNGVTACCVKWTYRVLTPAMILWIMIHNL